MTQNFANISPLVQNPSGKPPLDGLRVVDFTRVVAGPFGTQILGDLGADVIKIENPQGGDDSRHVHRGPSKAGETTMFMSINRSKRSVAVDLKSEAGRQVALDLIATADILVENFTGSVMRKFSLDYPSLKDRFPKLIYCSVSGYGRGGSNADAGGYDSPLGAEAGVIGLNRFPGGTPVLGGVPYTDLSTGLNSVIGILAALYSRTLTGRGQHVDIAMFDSALANLAYQGVEWLASGAEPMLFPPQGYGPNGMIPTADGHIVMTCSNDKMFHRLCNDVVERPDWLEHPRFATFALRQQHQEEFLEQANAVFRGKPGEEWSRRCKAAGIPCGAVRSVGEALMSDEAKERGLVFALEHPTEGLAPAIAQPHRFSETPVRYVTPPLLGQHTREVLAELPGYDEARLAELAETGAIALGKE
jgi:crotonobetainyl-CoA:carnitine CoA-transferase CaiB-like acyl-CoA transferase